MSYVILPAVSLLEIRIPLFVWIFLGSIRKREENLWISQSLNTHGTDRTHKRVIDFSVGYHKAHT